MIIIRITTLLYDIALNCYIMVHVWEIKLMCLSTLHETKLQLKNVNVQLTSLITTLCLVFRLLELLVNQENIVFGFSTN